VNKLKAWRAQRFLSPAQFEVAYAPVLRVLAQEAPRGFLVCLCTQPPNPYAPLLQVKASRHTHTHTQAHTSTHTHTHTHTHRGDWLQEPS
jgi:hypothetical protein